MGKGALTLSFCDSFHKVSLSLYPIYVINIIYYDKGESITNAATCYINKWHVEDVV